MADKGDYVDVHVEVPRPAYQTYLRLCVSWREVLHAGLESLVRKANRHPDIVPRTPRKGRAREYTK